MSVLGVVLAGGRSSRFGSDKALAMFKEGPGLVQQSMALIEKFMRSCGVTVELDVASVPNRGALFQQTVQDQRIVPRRSAPESQEPSS